MSSKNQSNPDNVKFQVAIYTRSASETQNVTSLEEQIEVCRKELVKRGWQVAGSYSDKTICCWRIDRNGLQELRTNGESAFVESIIEDENDLEQLDE